MNTLIINWDVPRDTESSIFQRILLFIQMLSFHLFVSLDFSKLLNTWFHSFNTDVYRYGIVVYSLKKQRSWRISDHLFYPDPLAAAYKVHDLEFEWTDGVFGLSLSPWDHKQEDRIMYYHPMSSFREFYVKTSVLLNETGWEKTKDAFRVMGQSRGKSGQVSASAMDRNGIMIYNLVTRDAIGCWDSRKPYKRSNLGVIAQSSEKLIFPNDLKIDKEENQSAWVISNRLPFYLYRGLNKNEINFRIMSASIKDAVKGTICDPELGYADSFEHFSGDQDCFWDVITLFIASLSNPFFGRHHCGNYLFNFLLQCFLPEWKLDFSITTW